MIRDTKTYLIDHDHDLSHFSRKSMSKYLSLNHSPYVPEKINYHDKY